MKMMLSSIALVCILVVVSGLTDDESYQLALEKKAKKERADREARLANELVVLAEAGGKPVCNCFNGVAAPFTNEPGSCEFMDQHKCMHCNPHYYLDSEDQMCHACAVGKYNLFVQFDPSHQHGVYGKAAEFYPFQSNHMPLPNDDDEDAPELDGASIDTCLDDPADAICSTLSYKPEKLEEGDTASCSAHPNSTKCMDKCDALHNCAYIASLNECHLKDPCVRKAKRSCRSKSHCKWDMDVGRCFQLGADASAESKLYRNNGLRDSDCNKKSFNGCINDFYCKWHDARPAPEGGVSEKGHNPEQRCMLHPCRQFSERFCGPYSRNENHFFKQADGKTDVMTFHMHGEDEDDAEAGTWMPKGLSKIKDPKDNSKSIDIGARKVRCVWNPEGHRCDTIKNSWSHVVKDENGKDAVEAGSQGNFWKWSTDLAVPQFLHVEVEPEPEDDDDD